VFQRRDFLKTSLGVVGGLAFSRFAWAEDSTTDMTAAATKFLAALSNDQRKAVQFDAGDAERFNWHFIPLNDTTKQVSARKGVCLDDMAAKAKAAALELLKLGTSADGYKWATAIMEREAFLGELEPKNLWFRKPGWYFYTVFGKPDAKGTWGWRIDGHHLSVSITITDGKIVSATPYFMGLNPVTIKHGPRKGERDTITPCEDLARDLFLMLNKDQQKVALQAEHLPEVLGKTVKAPDKLPTGLSAEKMSNKQQEMLLKLVGHYTGRMPEALAKIETDKLTKAGVEKLSFLYTGEAEAGKRHTYNIQGPSLYIHYMNEMTDPQKNPANHIHSIYRSIGADFGGAVPG
jgi:Protein of unknown function (DUF3500)